MHTGECELIDGKPGGISVTTGSRISALARSLPGPHLPDREGSRRRKRTHVRGRGEHELKGVPDRGASTGSSADIEGPDTRYVRTTDGIFIGFQVFGSDPHDLLLVPGFFSNLVADQETSRDGAFSRTARRVRRVVTIDRRGVGLSDRMSPRDLPPLEMRMEVDSGARSVRIPTVHLVTYVDGAGLSARTRRAPPSASLAQHVHVRPVRRSHRELPFRSEQRGVGRLRRGPCCSLGARMGKKARATTTSMRRLGRSNDPRSSLSRRYLALSAIPGFAISH